MPLHRCSARRRTGSTWTLADWALALCTAHAPAKTILPHSAVAAEAAVREWESLPERLTVGERPKAVGTRTVNVAAPAQMEAVVTVIGHCESDYPRVKGSPSPADLGMGHWPAFWK